MAAFEETASIGSPLVQEERSLEQAKPQRGEKSIPTRRVALEEELAKVPRYFAKDGDPLLSHLSAGLSALFPEGEEFFVRSVRHYRDRIEDPVLRSQVAGFIGQEAVHGREHRAFNRHLRELGYPTKAFERLTGYILRFSERISPPIANLAATAAIEHFTATLAEVVLTTETESSGFGDRASLVRSATGGHFGNQAVRDLFVWHALEESEHKAVAFDVYKAVGGPEWLRISTMKTVRVGFLVLMGVQMLFSVLKDPTLWSPRVLRASWKRFWSAPIMQKEVWRTLHDYDREGFHPDDRDTKALVIAWRERLFGEEGEMRSYLRGSAA
jgi:predicted metal-dependent hydrolase